MDKYHYRIDAGHWTLSRRDSQTIIELECDLLVFNHANNIENAAEGPDRAEYFRQLLSSGEVRNRAELARRFGISRARVTQILGPTKKAK